MTDRENSRSRIAVTGHGLICALGRSVAEAWPRVLRGERGIAPVTLFDVSDQRATLAAEVRGLEVPGAGAPRDLAIARQAPWSRTDAMALLAAREALAEARLDVGAHRVGLVVAGTTGGMYETEVLLARMHGDASKRVPAPAMLAHPLSATADRLQSALGPFTRTRTLCSACSSGANAFVLGAAWLELGVVDAVLVGGSDGLCRLTFSGFNALGAMDPAPARPFDVRRRGLTMGEGSGFAVLERADRAERRGVQHRAELVGFGVTSEAHHITNPAEDGLHAARAIEAALLRAGVSPDDIDYVNAHGTGTPLNDPMEARALAAAFGAALSRVWVSSTKAQIGHTLGAAGAIEAVFAALTIRDGMIPPTAGLEEIDPRCAALRHVPASGLEHAAPRVVISNAFGFGGVDTVLAFACAGYASEALGRVSHVPPRRVIVTGIGSASSAGLLGGSANAALVRAGEREHGDCAGDVPSLAAALDPSRARRLDRAARLAATAAQLASPHASDGILLGTAYGDTDASAAFLARVLDKGARFAPPADFPNLVPSSPAGHASIYLGLHGPALAVSDLATSGESAIVTAWELIAAGEFDSLVAGCVEPPSEITAACVEPVFRGLSDPQGDSGEAGIRRARARGEGAAVVRLETWPATDGAVAVEVVSATHALDARSLAEGLVAPTGRAAVVVGETSPSLGAFLAATPWRDVPIHRVVDAVGHHEGVGGFAVAAGAALVMRGDVDDALVVGIAPGRAYAIVLRRASCRGLPARGP